VSVRNRRRRERKRIEAGREHHRKIQLEALRSLTPEDWRRAVRFHRPDTPDDAVVEVAEALRDCSIRISGGTP